MDIDYGVIIGLIGAVCAAGVLGLSYVGAYMLGNARGRREVESERRTVEREEARLGHADRLLVVEGAVDSVARALERLADAQRLALLEQARPQAQREAPLGSARRAGHDTPA